MFLNPGLGGGDHGVSVTAQVEHPGAGAVGSKGAARGRAVGGQAEPPGPARLGFGDAAVFAFGYMVRGVAGAWAAIVSLWAAVAWAMAWVSERWSSTATVRSVGIGTRLPRGRKTGQPHQQCRIGAVGPFHSRGRVVVAGSARRTDHHGQDRW